MFSIPLIVWIVGAVVVAILLILNPGWREWMSPSSILRPKTGSMEEILLKAVYFGDTERLDQLLAAKNRKEIKDDCALALLYLVTGHLAQYHAVGSRILLELRPPNAVFIAMSLIDDLVWTDGKGEEDDRVRMLIQLLADVGTDEAYRALESLAKAGEPGSGLISKLAAERIDQWAQERQRKRYQRTDFLAFSEQNVLVLDAYLQLHDQGIEGFLDWCRDQQSQARLPSEFVPLLAEGVTQPQCFSVVGKAMETHGLRIPTSEFELDLWTERMFLYLYQTGKATGLQLLESCGLCFGSRDSLNPKFLVWLSDEFKLAGDPLVLEAQESDEVEIERRIRALLERHYFV